MDDPEYDPRREDGGLIILLAGILAGGPGWILMTLLVLWLLRG